MTYLIRPTGGMLALVSGGWSYYWLAACVIKFILGIVALTDGVFVLAMGM